MSSSPQDRLFRGIFEHLENARGELQHLLPAELSRRLDWSTLALERSSFIDEPGKNSHSELLFSLKLDQRDVFLYLLFEYQPTADPLLIYRQLKHVLRFMDRWLDDHPGATRLPPVIPLLVCHTPGGWSAPDRRQLFLPVGDNYFCRPYSAA